MHKEELMYDDGIDPDFNVAFRDISMDIVKKIIDEVRACGQQWDGSAAKAARK